jgi:hypothetical protein
MVIGIVLLVWMLFLMVKNAINISTKPATESEYDVRKKEFMSNMDERQYQFHESIRGASLTEIVATLEKRIHETEERLREYEQKFKDDNK